MGKVYASADWHGMGEIGTKVLDSLKSDDTLYFLGDAIDRGKDGIYLLNRLLEDPRVIFIKGNHEYLMELAAPKLLEDDWSDYYKNPIHDWFTNGGDKTWENIENFNSIKIKYYIQAIKNMPLTKIYHSSLGHNVILEHAGCTPFNPLHRIHDPLWDREHFMDIWTYEDPILHKYIKNTYLVHGHTPVQYLKFYYGYEGQKPFTKEEMVKKQKFQYGYGDFNVWDPHVIRYCDGHKFDIDLCTVESNKIVLLDLDTFERTYFCEK